MLRAQIGEPVSHAPLADHVSKKEHAAPDSPANKPRKTLQRGELDGFAIDPVTLAAKECVCGDEVQGYYRHEGQPGKSTQVDLGFQNGRVDQAITFLVKPQPIDEQVDPTQKQGQEDEDEDHYSDDDAYSAAISHGDSPALSSH